MVVVKHTCVGTYFENDSKCDLPTGSRSMSDINRTLDTSTILPYENCDPPFEMELYRASPELALKGGGTAPSNAAPHESSHV
jgi:hypothetical protein